MAVIKIINLERRLDRRQKIIKMFDKQKIKYQIITAVDGKQLQPTKELFELFKDNDFNYRVGVIGCAMSHLQLWKQLIEDPKNEYYVILEDDIEIVSNFNKKIIQVVELMISQGIHHTLIGGNSITIKNEKNELTLSLFKDRCETTCGYILFKEGAKILVDYISKHGIKAAIDNPVIFLHQTQPYLVNEYLVCAKNSMNGTVDTDIQYDFNCLKF